MTLPATLRIRRAIPRHLVLHYADLVTEEMRQVEGVPVTTPERTIQGVHADHIGPALVRQAIEDGRRTVQLTYGEGDRLEREFLGTESSPERGQPKRKPRAATR